MLTDTRCRTSKPQAKPYKLTDGGGLYLEVTAKGSKLWRYRFRLDGKENLYAIGAYPEIGLSEAREAMSKAKQLVKQGINPNHARSADKLAATHSRENTFGAIANEWMAKKRHGWSASTIRLVERVMKNDILPAIGMLPIRSVTPAHILAIMKKAEERGATRIAINLRQYCSAVFMHAVATLRADVDPTSALRGAVTPKQTRHHRALSRAEAIELMQRLKHYTGEADTIIAIKILAMTFVRTIELRHAKWTEIDLEAGRWDIPADKMKRKRAHTVPLAPQVVDLFRLLKQINGHREYVFPNRMRPNDCMSAGTINRALERMKFAGTGTIGFTGHGFRATASTMLNEMGYRPDVIERQLAHAPSNGVRAAYNQADYMVERADMMKAWANIFMGFINGDSNVIPMRLAAS